MDREERIEREERKEERMEKEFIGKEEHIEKKEPIGKEEHIEKKEPIEKEKLGRIYGYARVSTERQRIERQIKSLTEYCKDIIIVDEVYTGRTSERPRFQKLLKQLKDGDTVVFDEVSRMSRNAEEGIALYEELFNKEIELIFLNEHYIDTSVYRNALKNSLELTGTNVDYILDGINKYLMTVAKEQIKLAFEQAEKEVNDLSRRTKLGIEQARIAGKQIGRVEGTRVETKKAKKSKEILRKYCKDFGGSLSDLEVIKLAKINRNTFYTYKRELRAEKLRALMEGEEQGEEQV